MTTAAYRAAHKAEIAAYNKAYSVANKERLAAYRAERKEELAAYHKIYYAANKERIAAYNKGYEAAHPEERGAAAKRMRLLYPEKAAARRKVNHAVEAGNFPPANTMVCELCEEALAQHWHHHNGYDEEHSLDVIAVCRECHTLAHKETDNAE